MAKLPSKLPSSLGILPGTGGLYTDAGYAYNYAIGGLPWLSAADREHPIVRETADVRKQQFDSQQTPGEQSLDGWWYRSQISFHGGAGQVYGDPTQDNQYADIRFRSSRNVDVWTQGQVSLLNSVKAVSPSPITGVVDMTEIVCGNGVSAAFAVTTADYHVVTATTLNTDTDALLTNIQAVTTDGTRIFIATLTGVFSTPMLALPSTNPTWTKQYNYSTSAAVSLAFVKSRLILTVGPAIYELAPAPVGPPVALPTAKYTHLDTAWSWTGITETSTAIFVVGNNGVRGSILKFVLEADGEVPTLSGGSVAAQLPFGEVVWSATGYLGSYVGIGTNKGVRVASADENGNLTYGPLLFSSDSPVKAWTARDRFLWCTVSRGSDGHSGLYRIDLSLELAELRFPYAVDVVADGDVSDCVAVANVGAASLVCFATAGNLYVEDSSSLAASGYLQTSRVRYGTLEPKLYKLLRVRGPVLAGPLAFQTLDSNDSPSAAHQFVVGDNPGDEDQAINSPTAPSDFVSIKFTLTRGVVVTQGSQIFGYQLKAVPGGPRQRMIQLPLLVFDRETNRHGVVVTSSAARRLGALESLEDAGASVVLQDFDMQTTTQCVVERISFRQVSPPAGAGGMGGIAMITLRTI